MTSRFTTADLPLAAYLLVVGLTLAELDKSDPRRQLFVFEGNAEPYLAGYLSRKALVDPISMYEQIKNLKRALYL